uniref:Uncharacterized protein n=1 Tax=Molossus molossus TaxID=27622 RepID=A0A7J8E2M2_MOLMO|nr:hypothetical protein HJG59_009014 [Molossus molossus]
MFYMKLQTYPTYACIQPPLNPSFTISIPCTPPQCITIQVEIEVLPVWCSSFLLLSPKLLRGKTKAIVVFTTASSRRPLSLVPQRLLHPQDMFSFSACPHGVSDLSNKVDQLAIYSYAPMQFFSFNNNFTR